jgi:hypothetical protein
MIVGARVYARAAIRYASGAQVIHKGGRGTVVGVIGDVPYVRWDWTGETYPASVRQLGRLS